MTYVSIVSRITTPTKREKEKATTTTKIPTFHTSTPLQYQSIHLASNHPPTQQEAFCCGVVEVGACRFLFERLSAAARQQESQPTNQPTMPRKRKRPPPTPPPPASLVKLLGKDKKVLQYFQALQANLESDVQIWKDRAHAWEQQVKALQTNGKDKKSKAVSKKAPPSHLSNANDSSDSDKSDDGKRATHNQPKSPKRAKTDENAHRKASPTTTKKPARSTPKDKNGDGVFALESDSDDNDLDLDKDVFATADSTLQMEPDQKKHHSNQESSKQNGDEITDDLLSFPSDSSDDDDAKVTATKKKGNSKTFLSSLEKNDDSDNNDDDSDDGLSLSGKPAKTRVPPESKPYLDQVETIFCEYGIRPVDPDNPSNRRSDTDMVKDLQFALETFCRVAAADAELLSQFPPVHDGKPAPNPQHPARVGLREFFQALVWLETFGPEWKGTDWYDRQGFVRAVEQTLRREVRQGWAVKDRTARLNESSSEFRPEKEDDEIPINTDEVSVKSVPKLSFIVERCCWARMLMGLYVSRNDTASAVQSIREYIVATVPGLGKEASLHPRLYPVLSFVVLEAMVKPCLRELGWDLDKKCDEVELHSHIWGPNDASSSSMYVFAIHRTASIWKERTTSRQDRIQHAARAEYAAYQRLCQDCGLGKATVSLDVDGLAGIRASLEMNLGSKDALAAYQLCLVCGGSLDLSYLVWFPEKTLEWNLNYVDSWCFAIRQVYLRGLEDTKRGVASKVILNSPADTLLDECREQFGWLWDLNPFESNFDKVQVLYTLVKCAACLADGDSVIRYGDELVNLLKTMKMNDCQGKSLRGVWDVVRDVLKRPMARVINLQRRHDRWKHMMSQAMEHNFLIVRGIGNMQDSASTADGHLTHGGYAIDGEWPRSKVIELAGSPAQLAKMVQTDWQPLELAPFDRDAPRHEKMVTMHPSEVACALSHIACWKACNRSFGIVSDSPLQAPPPISTGLIQQPDALLRGLHLAGYARGAPLHGKNAGLPPTPVCLVLEDDAHVVDDFCAALHTVLAELPRDFHYCALGYSRPKSAPIVHLWGSRPHVGVPTHLYFATGYLVSPAGLSYLREHGPVQGPVDAWLGLRQTRNFDNLVGQRLGVGSHGKGGHFSAAKASQILDFMAYCAVPPLCSQPMRHHHHGKGQRWKDKDTNIVYSGHK